MISTPVNLFHEPTGRFSQVELAQVSYWVEDGWTLLPSDQGGLDDLDAALAARAGEAQFDPNSVEAVYLEFIEEPNLIAAADQAEADAAAALAALNEAQAAADAAQAASEAAQAAVTAAQEADAADAAAGLASVTEGEKLDTETSAEPAPAEVIPTSDPSKDSGAPTASAQPEVVEPVAEDTSRPVNSDGESLNKDGSVSLRQPAPADPEVTS